MSGEVRRAYAPAMRSLRRPLVAGGLLLAVTVGALGDALAGGQLMDVGAITLAAAVAGYLAGAWLPPVAASLGCAAGAALLTAANQVTAGDDYIVPNDLFFFAVLLRYIDTSIVFNFQLFQFLTDLMMKGCCPFS